MAKRGPKLTPISTEQFEKLCALHCTLREIAEWFNCSEDTIERWCKRTYKEKFADIWDKKRSKGRISIRRKQYELAMKGDRTLLIWLGKQWLGQMERQEVNNKVSTDGSKLIIDLTGDKKNDNES